MKQEIIMTDELLERVLGGDHGDDDYNGDGIPLSDTTRFLLIIVHYLTFPFVTFTIYAFVKKFDVLVQRIWSPFFLLIALTWLLIGPAFEIGNHFYIDNWQLYRPVSDLINGSFSFFNFGSQNILAVSLRKPNRPFFRCGTSILDWFSIFADLILPLLIFVNPLVYALAGRSKAVAALSPLAAVAGLFTLFRAWFNLGPNVYTKVGSILFFVLVILGVILNAVYKATDAEWVHIFIGGSFVSSTIPLGVAILNAERLGDIDLANEGDEEAGTEMFETVTS